MAKRNSNAIDKARQYLAKSAKVAAKLSRKKIQGIKKETAAKRDRETIARWRVLKKLGLITTRDNPAKKNLTARLKTKINKEFHSVQGEGQYIKGKTARPFNREVIKGAKGERIKYTLTGHFKFLRTKKKTTAKTGVIKTSKGYIIQRDNVKTKISIDNNGDLIKKTGKERTRSRAYKGDKILELYSEIKENRLDIRPGEVLAIKKWNSQTNIEMFERDTLEQFTQLIDQYAREMSSKVFRNFIDVSEVVFIRGI